MPISLQTISSDIYRLAEEVWLRLLRLDDNSDREMASDRPSRRLQATRQAPRRATPCQDLGLPACLRKLRQTGSVAPVEFRPLRSRPHSATAPFAPKQRGPRACGSAAGCAVPSSPAARLSPQAPTDWLCAPCWPGCPSLPLARVHCRAQLRSAWRVPARRWAFPPPIAGGFVKVRCRLPNQGRWSAIEHNAGIMRSAKTALSASPHNLHYV